MLIRMHLSLLIFIVALGVATVSYLRASRVERDQLHLRRRLQKELGLKIGRQMRAEDQKQKAEEEIASSEAFPRNGDQAEELPWRMR